METKEGSYSKGSAEEKIKAQELCKQSSRTIVNLLFFFKENNLLKEQSQNGQRKYRTPKKSTYVCPPVCGKTAFAVKYGKNI